MLRLYTRLNRMQQHAATKDLLVIGCALKRLFYWMYDTNNNDIAAVIEQ